MLMGLNHDQFVLVQQGTKTIEIRLYDEKQSRLKIGHKILFTDLENDNQITVSVTQLYKFTTFSDLYERFHGAIVGSNPTDDIQKMVNDTYKIYTPEQEKYYGVLAIEILLCDKW
ncbi:ASCH domain-containing protein [Leuconostoc mesenteroides]